MTASGTQINYETSWLVNEVDGRAHIINVLKELQQRYAISGRRIVELGSGIGTNLAALSSPANSLQGIEGMPLAAAESVRRGIPCIEADLERDVPLPDQSADWILCIDVLEHLMNPQTAVQSAYRILRDDGYFVVNVPNHFDWRGRFRILKGSGIDSQRYFAASPHWEYPHVRFFSRSSIEEMLNRSGFEVIEDLRQRFLSFPKAHIWKSFGLQAAMESLQSRWPDLFSSGFFLLCRKKLGA
jgi:SAM-dependent methyltransferase